MGGVLNNKLKPLARSDDLVVEEIGDELLVADRKNNRAHSLNPLAARVWQACDGEMTTEQLVATLDADPAAVAHALAELSDCELLERDGPVIVGNGGMTRRDLGVKAAKVGVATAVVSVALPVAEAAATPTPAQCLLYTDRDCNNCTNICGCCCCGQAGGETDASCKTCYTTSGCSSITFTDSGNEGDCSTTSEHGGGCEPAQPSYDCKTTGNVPPKTVTLVACTRCCDAEDFTPADPCNPPTP